MILAVTVSCKKSFLEIKPKGIVIATKTSDYDLFLNNLDLINIGTNAQHILGDEVVMKDPAWTGASFREKQLFKWDYNIYTPVFIRLGIAWVRSLTMRSYTACTLALL